MWGEVIPCAFLCCLTPISSYIFFHVEDNRCMYCKSRIEWMKLKRWKVSVIFYFHHHFFSINPLFELIIGKYYKLILDLPYLRLAALFAQQRKQALNYSKQQQTNESAGNTNTSWFLILKGIFPFTIVPSSFLLSYYSICNVRNSKLLGKTCSIHFPTFLLLCSAFWTRCNCP